MSNEITTPTSWKTRTYVMGAVVGAVFGLASAFLYSRAAEEEAERGGGQPAKIPTMTLISMLLTALGLARQIADAGKPKK